MWLTLKCVTCASSVLYHLPVFETVMHSCQGPCYATATNFSDGLQP